ncbi:uncharacterized protein BDW47DRAFT_110543 [Aspergillus candidus]|uniref:Uncharacterized protein n=1 Tax=Aspergillus candidus TaxID=41067 RepID=A0A2I2F447_ASPCN|nr:hypothetical protein BDW47DRAFT_110543 [Aspergillus candidus]PLB35410.1 hypothetical protein BDW47DRAFT_110543 [Aspergillus candidus]
MRIISAPTTTSTSSQWVVTPRRTVKPPGSFLNIEKSGSLRGRGTEYNDRWSEVDERWLISNPWKAVTESLTDMRSPLWGLSTGVLLCRGRKRRRERARRNLLSQPAWLTEYGESLISAGPPSDSTDQLTSASPHYPVHPYSFSHRLVLSTSAIGDGHQDFKRSGNGGMRLNLSELDRCGRDATLAARKSAPLA